MSELVKLGGYVVQGHGYNETVLWEGIVQAPAGANLNVTINLSESIKNFEYVVVFLTDETWALGLCSPVLLDTNSPAAKKVISEGSSTNVYIGYLIQCPTTTTLTYRCGYSNSFGNCFTGEYWEYGKPYKIVGINRKEGV